MDKSKAESVVAIDDKNLDRECILLPTQYIRAAFQAAEAKRDAVEAKNLLSVIEADMAKEVRGDPVGFGIEKVTEAAVNAAVITSGKFRKAKQAQQDADYNSDIAQALVWAMEHKKRALTMLVELHGMGYFSAPKISEDGKRVIEQQMQRRARRPIDD